LIYFRFLLKRIFMRWAEKYLLPHFHTQKKPHWRGKA
jgi:hypothetical protein